MIGVILIITLIITIGISIYYAKNQKNMIKELETEQKKEYDFNMIFMVSLVLFVCFFLLSVLFSEKVIKFFMNSSKFITIGITLNKIKNFFVGSSKIKLNKIQMGGSNKINELFNGGDDELPDDSDSELDF
jgi:hypothetical protein